ncbi:cupin domain-containing protein [Alkalibacillus silvisoli]|uniref:Cupin type-2 domain-containing protein n=1 Tax=Alkalibacillus silvisoli TaxID=392823 RepID=A0ABN0ZNA7_9BACI
MQELKAGRSITHKFTKERITFLKTSRETEGAYEYIEVDLPPAKEGPGLHYHNNFEEEFEVIDGKLKVTIAEEDHVLQQGETKTITKETNHTFSNASEEQSVTFRVKITPAHQFEESMRILYGLMEDGKTNDKGVPNNKTYAAIALYMQDSRVVRMPFLLKYFLNYLAKKGKKKGVDKELIEKYGD